MVYSQKEVYKTFKLYFPELVGENEEKVDVWFQNGKNSVRVRFKNHAELIFTFNGKQYWKLETVGSWIDGLN